MIRSSVLFPAPLLPSTPILAPGQNDSQMPLRISRLGGTSLRKSFITNVYWAVMVAAVIPVRASRGYHPSSASLGADGVGKLRPAARAQPVGDRLALDALDLAAVRADD